jgi:hypothetical protein
MLVEITALAQFAIFLSLPVAEQKKGKTAIGKVRGPNLARSAS